MTNWHVERLAEPALQGLSTGTVDRRAMHLHGSWGNFYENTIALDTQAPYSRHGYGFAAVNTRGHDAGTISEDLSDTSSDISAWMDHFDAQGTDRWVLQGHSLGALKIIRGMLDHAFGNRVSAVVLLSPFDLPAFYAGSGDAGAIEAKKTHVEQLMAKRGANVAVPEDIFSTWPVSLGTIRSALSIGGPLDVFRSRDGDVNSVGNVGVPTLVVLGGADFAATPDNHRVADLVEKVGAEVTLVEGAPHNFAGFEVQVNAAIAQFLAKLA
ncbi:hypothetical protein BKD30_15325 [Tersicoccus phoenicis]|uniref:AB hydrolase-1 domain-containing protein n=1 Tax=Tersicoccus phoenicis TaxID=554083 RepID=A0A1R1L5X0_9MICC|nr:hypothetical protein BKD30_15325 [Tersicoccus phoenicis]